MTEQAAQPSEQETFLRAVFGQEQGYLFVSTLDRHDTDREHGWRDRSFVYPLQMTEILNTIRVSDAAGLDVYIAAQLYKAPQGRKKAQVKTCPSVWSDLDTASPYGVNPEPSVILETSPGRWHGFWRTPKPLGGPEAEEWSRRIAYAHHREGADLGGWDLTQVLRVPGTHNHKYPDQPIVRLAKCDPTPIAWSAFETLPAAPSRHVVDSPATDPTEPPVPLEGDELAAWQQDSASDRSGWAMRMTRILKEHGLADRLVEVALANHPIYLAKAREKWGNKESLIYDDIRRCLQKYRESPTLWIEIPGGHITITAPTEQEAPSPFLRPISELLCQPERPVDWLVTDLFSVGSSGWVGAEPKVGKSWLTLELIYCLTTASTYLERFSILQPRRVVYIQEEDSEQRVLRRFNQLLRGVPGREPPPDEYLRFAIRAGFKIDSPTWIARLRAELTAWPAEVCVFDVFQRLHLKSENDQAQMAAVLAELDTLNREFGCAFIVVHHNRKPQTGNEARPNQMLRGSGVLAGWAECSLYLRAGQGPGRIVVIPESKDAAAIDEFVVTLTDTADGGVQLVTSVPQSADRLAAQEAAVLASLRRLAGVGTDCTAQRVADDLGWKKASAYRVLRGLVDKGQAVTDEAVMGRNVVTLYQPADEEV